MAKLDHLKRLKQGVKSWNAWRRQDKFTVPDLSGTRLFSVDLTGIDLSDADLGSVDMSFVTFDKADLTNANLQAADLNNAKLREADLSGANLDHANLHSAKLARAHLVRADLSDCELTDTDFAGADLSNALLVSASLQGANFTAAKLIKADLGISYFYGAEVYGADFTKARLFETSFVETDLSGVLGLETCEHMGPSIVDHRTLQKSGLLPLSFLRGVGLPEAMIEYLPAILNKPIQLYSCFISYSTEDDNFAERLHADLQDNGVRCWFAPHDMPIGGKILDEIDSAIRLRDKVLLILSECSIKSDWVENEVIKAFEEERKRGQTVLFPIRLDDAVMGTDKAWASTLRAQRNIGDFRRWKEHDEYQESFARVLRDLTVKNDG